jgi:hypothetical protein
MNNTTMVIGALLLVASSTTYAATWSGPVKVASIETIDAGGVMHVYLTFTTDPYPNHTCPNKGGGFYRLGGNTDTAKQMSTLATSALLASRPITVLWNDGCESGYPVLRGLTLK